MQILFCHAAAPSDIIVNNCDDGSLWKGGSITKTTIKEGTGAIEWKHGVENTITLLKLPTDFSKRKTLSFWMNSNVNNGQAFRLNITSENSATDGSDYYQTTLFANFTGWKLIEINLLNIKVARTPLGKDKITGLFFVAGSNGDGINPANTIIIDDIRLTGDLPQPVDAIATLKSSHPRLVMTTSWDDLRKKVADSPELQGISKKTIDRANRILNEPVSTFSPFPSSVRILTRSYELSYAYRMTNDRKYLDRAYKEYEAVANFPTWTNGVHFLGTSEITHAFAIGYDWLYDALSPAQRDVMKKAIIKNGLNAYLDNVKNNSWWLFSKWNWNAVTNSGIGMGALAIADTEPALANEIINKTLFSMKTSGLFDEFGPDGGWPEGPLYWNYCTKYLITYAACLESATGDSYGLLDHPAIKLTGNYPVYMQGQRTNSLFNYADGGNDKAPWLFWLGKKFNNPLLTWFQKRNNQEHPNDIIWYQTNEKSPTELKTPLDAYFRNIEVATFRESWEDVNGIFVGFKAGSNAFGHSHLDLGEFVLDANGERWINDFGGDNYGLPGYFGAERWNYHRTRAEGNNTLVINPSKGADQDPGAVCKITRFSENKGDTSFAIADLTDAYNEMGATRVTRGIALINKKTQVLLQDEIVTTNPTTVWSFMNTWAALSDITISDDGRSAILTLNSKRMSVKILGTSPGKIEKMEFIPLPTSPNPAGQNVQGRKLAVRIEGQNSITLRILFTPLKEGEDPGKVLIPNLLSLTDKRWPIDAGQQQLIADGVYEIKSTTLDERLANVKADNNALMQPAVTTADNQKWVVNHLGDNVYTIKNVETNTYLEVPYAKCGDGDNVGTFLSAIQNHQKWKIIADGKYFSLMPAHCLAKALDRSKGLAGGNAQIWTYNKGFGNQKWQINALNDSGGSLSTQEFSKVKDIYIYPNPVTDMVTINGLKIGENIVITDLLGKTVLNTMAKQNEEMISTSSFSSGIYIVTVGETKTMKLIKK
jgi:hypothetical protein